MAKRLGCLGRLVVGFFASVGGFTVLAVVFGTDSPDKPSTIVYVTTKSANLRSGPGTDYAIVGGASIGDQFKVESDNGDWLEVSFGPKTAWIYDSLTGNHDALQRARTRYNSASSQTLEKNVKTHNQPKKTEILIPRSRPEKAKYYLLSIRPDRDYIRTLHKRVSSMSLGFSVTLIDCARKKYQDLGYGEDKQENIQMYSNTRWTDLVNGSSKSDLVKFVCNRQ